MSDSHLVLRRSRVTRGLPGLEHWLARRLFKAVGPAPVRLILRNGPEYTPPGITPVATVIIQDRRTLANLVRDPEVAFGEAYAEGLIQVDGNLPEALAAIYAASTQGRAEESRYSRLMSKWMEWIQDNSRRGSLRNVHHHYDLGNDFYKLWLDSRMVYTCAYFPLQSCTLDEAQAAKLDYVCRKLQLKRGETVVEAGCGWGALAIHMAQHYGVSVKAFNISREQIAYARQQAIDKGLTDRVQFVQDDYRNISGRFDVFVSVGMLEHVGLRHYAEFGQVIYRAIGDRGRGFVHFIGRSYKGDFSRWIRKRVFPGAYAPTLAEAINILQPYRYSVLDVENLRLHYAKTLEHWLQRFETSSQQISEMYDSWLLRAWRLYLAGSLAAFRTGTLQLFQICFAGPNHGPTSWTRAPLYAEHGCGAQLPNDIV